MAGPKHSISVPSSDGVAVPLSVDKYEGPLVPNPAPEIAVKTLPGPQIGEESVRCIILHLLLSPSLLLFTLQIVTPLMFPVTVQLKVKVSPAQVGWAAVNCPVTAPRDITVNINKKTACGQLLLLDMQVQKL